MSNENLGFLNDIFEDEIVDDTKKERNETKNKKPVEKQEVKVTKTSDTVESINPEDKLIDFPIHQIELIGKQELIINDCGLEVIYQNIHSSKDDHDYKKYAVETFWDGKRQLSNGLVSEDYLITKIDPLIEYLEETQNMRKDSEIFNDLKLIIKLLSEKVELDIDEIIQLIYGIEDAQYDLNMTLDLINGYSGFSKLQVIPGIKLTDVKNDIELASITFPTYKIKFRHYNSSININMNLEHIGEDILNLMNQLKNINITREEFEKHFIFLVRDYKKLYNFLEEWFETQFEMKILFMILLVEKYLNGRKNTSYFKKNQVTKKILEFAEKKSKGRV
jgi:hypothetical protein